MAKLIKKEIGPIRHDHIYQIEFDKVGSFIKDCWSLKHKTSIETLDAKKSYGREIRTDISQQEVLDKIYKSNHKFFSFILRKGLPFFHTDAYFWEFCAIGEEDSIEYFLWIEVSKESGYKLVEKYDLKKNYER